MTTTTENAASVQQRRTRTVPHDFRKAEADLRFTLGGVPGASAVAALLADLLAHGLVADDQRARLIGAQAGVRDGSVSPETAYLVGLAAARVVATEKALRWLDSLYTPHDVMELAALAATGKGRASVNGRLGMPEERAKLADFIAEHYGRRSLYAGINPRPETFAGTRRTASASEIAERRFVVLDFDDKTAANGDGHAVTIADLRAHQPVAEVMSGNGTHLWWPVAPGAENAGFTEQLNGAMKAVGADSIANPDRIIRLPWTINVPTDRKRRAGADVVLATVVQDKDRAAPVRTVDTLIELWRGDGSALAAGPATERSAELPSSLHAPDKAAVLDALARLPNSDGADAEFATRNAELAVAHAVRGSVLGTAFEDDPDIRQAFLDWAAKFGDDAEHAGLMYDGIRSSRTGWPDLRAMLHERVPAAAYETAPDPAQAEQIAGIANPLEAGVPNWVAEVNLRYAYLESADRILDISPDTGQVDKYLTPEQFKTRLGNQMIASGNRSVGLGQAWLTHPQRRQYSRLGWWPEGQEPKGALNQWRGFPSSTGLEDDPEWRPLPITLPDPLTPTLKFVENVIASGRQNVSEYLLSYLAWKVQHPTARPGTALALVGASGTGKTTVGTMVADLFGPQHSRSISKPDQVLGRFNAALEGAMFLSLEEAFFGGDRRIRGIYKDLITSPTINIERKGVDIGAPTPNMAAIVITSNEMSAIPHEPGERRTTFIRVSNVHRRDAAYFGALHGNWTSGGREAFLNFLLKRDVSQFNPRQALSTAEKAEAAGENGDLPVQFWTETLDSGKLPMMLGPDGAEPDWSAGCLTVSDSALHSAFVAFAKDRGAHPQRLETKAGLIRRLAELCPAMKATQPRPNPNQPGIRSHAFPPLDECRRLFTEAMGGES